MPENRNCVTVVTKLFVRRQREIERVRVRERRKKRLWAAVVAREKQSKVLLRRPPRNARSSA